MPYKNSIQIKTINLTLEIRILCLKISALIPLIEELMIVWGDILICTQLAE